MKSLLESYEEIIIAEKLSRTNILKSKVKNTFSKKNIKSKVKKKIKDKFSKKSLKSRGKKVKDGTKSFIKGVLN